MTNSNLQHITHKIYFFRGVPVLLDRDLAQWFEVKPIRLREQVKRNIKRFPKHFRFVLNEQEVDVLLSQNAIPSRKVLGGSLPQVFTEKGLYMLATILKNKQALIDGDFDPVWESHRPKLSHQSSGCTEATERTLSLSKCVEVAKRPLRRK